MVLEKINLLLYLVTKLPSSSLNYRKKSKFSESNNATFDKEELKNSSMIFFIYSYSEVYIGLLERSLHNLNTKQHF